LHRKPKLNQIQQNTRINLNQAIQITDYGIKGLETEWDDYGIKGRDGQKKKIGKANEKRKREK